MLPDLPSVVAPEIVSYLDAEYGHIEPLRERIMAILRASVAYRRSEPIKSYNFSLYTLALLEQCDDKATIAHVYYALFTYKSDLKGEHDPILLERAYELFEAVNDEPMLMKLRHAKAYMHAIQGRLDTALELCEQNKEYILRTGRYGDLHVVVMRINSILEKKGHFSRIITESRELLQILEMHGLKDEDGTGNACIAMAYRTLGEYERALEYFLKGVESRPGRYINRATALRNVGDIYMHLSQPDKALEYLEQAKDIAEELGHIAYYAGLLQDIGRVYANTNRHDAALQYYQKSLLYNATSDDKRLMPTLLFDVGRLYVQMEMYSDACDYLNRALLSAREQGHKQTEYTVLEFLGGVYQTTGEYAIALEYFRQYMELKEKVLNEVKAQALAEMQIKLEVEYTKRERRLLHDKNTELQAALQEVRDLNEQLVRLDKEKNEVLGIVAHDLKSPLAGIRMVASSLKEYYRRMPADAVEQQLESIVETTDRMLDISSSLLSAQQISNEKQGGIAARVDVGALVRRIAEGYSHMANKKNIALNIDAEESVYTWTVEEYVRQVVDNLLSNALKFTQPGQSVGVRVVRNKRTMTVEVWDRGVGMKPADRRKMYRKYSRLSARPTGGESSTGLGLWIVHRAAEQLGAKLKCRSTEGVGTVFTLELPKESA